MKTLCCKLASVNDARGDGAHHVARRGRGAVERAGGGAGIRQNQCALPDGIQGADGLPPAPPPQRRACLDVLSKRRRCGPPGARSMLAAADVEGAKGAHDRAAAGNEGAGRC